MVRILSALNTKKANELLLLGLLILTTSLRFFGFSDPEFQRICKQDVNKESYFSKNTCDHYTSLAAIYSILNTLSWLMFALLLGSVCRCCKTMRGSSRFSKFQKLWVVVFSLLVLIASIIELIHPNEPATDDNPLIGSFLNLKFLLLQWALFCSACCAIWSECEGQSSNSIFSIFVWKNAVYGLIVISIVFILEAHYLFYETRSYGGSVSNTVLNLGYYYIESFVLLIFSIVGMYLLSTASFALHVNQTWKKNFTRSRIVWITLFTLLALANVVLECIFLESLSENYWFSQGSNKTRDGPQLDETFMAWIVAIICKAWLFSKIVYEASKSHDSMTKDVPAE